MLLQGYCAGAFGGELNTTFFDPLTEVSHLGQVRGDDDQEHVCDDKEAMNCWNKRRKEHRSDDER